MSDNPQLPAYIRTYIPLLVTVLGTWLAQHGLNIDGTLLQVVVGAALGAAYYAVVRFLEGHKAQFGWLLGVAKQPAYAPGPAPAPDTGEQVTADVVPDTAPEVGD
jgi:hypothetical protein